MDVDRLIRRSGEWLRGDGPGEGIVISTRIRLARNLADSPFAVRLAPEARARLIERVLEALAHCPSAARLAWYDLEGMSVLDRQILVERHLISREQEEAEGPRGAAVDPEETLSLMVIEEDHLRLQALRSGLRLEEAWAAADRIDSELGARLDFAFDPEYGFLTACPTNLGTGMRVSVMLHLPALVMTRHADRAFRAAHDLKMNVRGLYGEGTEALGEFYQISNQVTTGRPEGEILADIRATLEVLLRYETAARERLLAADRISVEDRVWRAWATLRHARTMSSEEAMKHLSSVRLGAALGLLPALDQRRLNTVFLLSQPAHLQRLEGRELPPPERDAARARYLREQLTD